MSIHIPAVGELLGAALEGTVKVAHVTFGPATTNDVVGAAVGSYVLFEVDEPIVILNAWTQVETAFNGTVTVDLGDSGGASELTASATIVPGSSGAVLIGCTGLASVPLMQNKDDNILVAIGDTPATAGKMHVYFEYVVVDEVNP